MGIFDSEPYWKDMPVWQKILMTVVILPIMALTIVGLPVVIMTILDILEEEDNALLSKPVDFSSSHKSLF